MHTTVKVVGMAHTYGSQPRLGTATNAQDAQTNSTSAVITTVSQSFAALKQTAGGAAAPGQDAQRPVVRVVGRPAATAAAVAATAARATAATDNDSAAAATVAAASAAAATVAVADAAATADAAAATADADTAVPSDGGRDDALTVDTIAAAADVAAVSYVWEDILSSDNNLTENTQAAGVSLSQVVLLISVVVALYVAHVCIK